MGEATELLDLDLKGTDQKAKVQTAVEKPMVPENERSRSMQLVDVQSSFLNFIIIYIYI